jgi:hypothetical protein
MDPGATLPDNNRPGMDFPAAVRFNAHPLAIGVPTITRGAYAFFMSHYKFLSLFTKQNFST